MMTDPSGRNHYGEPMRDSEVVASIVAGEPAGLATAYDKYAGDLYSYCQSLLQDPNDAADAVQDTFVIAASKLGGLRDPERLRAWLFAVSRNECMHRLKTRNVAAPLQDAPEQADDSVDVGGAAERAETVALVRAAVGGLNDGERDVITQLWHGLDVPEVADVLGVSRNHAYTLFARARDQLEASVAVLLVGRAGRRDCATLDSLLGDWDGRLTALLRKRVGRHIDRCEVCSDRRRRELTPALLYGLSPAAVLSMAGLHKLSLLAAGQAGGPLSVVRDTILRVAADPASHATAYAHAAAGSTQSFGASGFPKPPPHHGYLNILQRPHVPMTVAGGTAVTAAAVAVVTAVLPHMPPAHPPGGGPKLSVPAAAPFALSSAPSGSPSGGRTDQPTTDPATGGTSPATGASTSPGATASDGSTSPDASVSDGTTSPAATATDCPTPTATWPGPSDTGTSPTTLSAGALSVSPTTVAVSPWHDGSLTLTASDGPVAWSISEPAWLRDKLKVTPMSGTLNAGDSVTVAITMTERVSLDTELTVQPGDQTVTVRLRSR
jgi:RNA polymerase sigma factor (sigma-70 family)